MRALDVANAFLEGYADRFVITNLKLNKLVFFAQVLSLKTDGVPLFSDSIEAWEYGPVVRSVYREFKRYGSSPICAASAKAVVDNRARAIVNEIACRYIGLTAFDLVELSHRDDGAWKLAYCPTCDNEISIDAMLAANDLCDRDGDACAVSFADAINAVENKWPNALRMLEDA